MKARYAAIFSAVLGSICCVGPLLLVALGLGTFAALIGRSHWIFIGGAIAALAWAWVKHFRERTRCACEHRTMDGHGISLVILLLASAIVVAFAVLNIGSYVLAGSPPPVASTQSVNLQRIAIRVEGMSCATCSFAVRHALKGVNGVETAHVSIAKKRAMVDYESSKTNPKQLVAAINSTGYHATLPQEDPQSISKDLPVESGGVAGASTSRISLFEVPLRCPAAPQIGCGSAAKPILLELERQPGVAEAWLNRAGTRIAVVWKPGADAKARSNAVATLTDDAREMQGKFRDETLKDFSSGKGWYRGPDVDRLSEEEAGIIATRLVRRVEAKTTLAQDKAERLETVLAAAFKKKFTEQRCKGLSVRQLTGDFLDDRQIAILEGAIEKGVRPLPNES